MTDKPDNAPPRSGAETKADTTAGLSGLEALIAQSSEKGLPPVHLWNPDYCGEIGMRIASDGTWFYQGSPIGRKPLVRLFSTVLRKDEDGQTYLVTPVEKIGIDVDDAPFLGVEMAVTGIGRDQVLTFRTNVDDVVECGPDHPLRFEVEEPHGGLKPYLLVRGRLEALVTRALYYDLVELAVTDGAGDNSRFGLWSGGEFFEMAH